MLSERQSVNYMGVSQHIIQSSFCSLCPMCSLLPIVNLLPDTLKQQSNGQKYRNTVIGTLAVDGWAVTFGTERRRLSGL